VRCPLWFQTLLSTEQNWNSGWSPSYLVCLMDCLAPYICNNHISFLVPFCILQRIIMMYEKVCKGKLLQEFLEGRYLTCCFIDRIEDLYSWLAAIDKLWVNLSYLLSPDGWTLSSLSMVPHRSYETAPMV